MRKRITLIFLAISIISNAQMNLNPSIYKPDSAISYLDTTESSRVFLLTYQYDYDSIDIEINFYESDTINYALRIVYYMDNNLVPLPFDPIYFGGINGNRNNYYYTYNSSIGDTLSISYVYDFSLGIWKKDAKTKHNISIEGIDTSAISHIRDDNSESWELNNLTKQVYVDALVDTLKILTLAPNLTDTIKDYIISYEYNSEGEKFLKKEITPGSQYSTIDSITYYPSGNIEFIYMGNNYDCANSQLPNCDNKYLYKFAEQYFYDKENNLDKIYYWIKQNDLNDWLFDGYLKYYYSDHQIETRTMNTEDTFSFFPNPCRDNLKVSSFSGTLEIYNAMGELLLSKQINERGEINISALSNGIYILKLGNSQGSILIKEKGTMLQQYIW